MTELSLDLAKVRTLHSVDAAAWLGRPSAAYWCEWDHWGETPRPLSLLIEQAKHLSWDRFIRPGSTCIDIGAHSGDTAIPMGLFAFDPQLSRQGCVVAVEPNPEVFDVLTINLTLNRAIADFRPVRVAVTASDVDEIELADHGNSNCNGGIIEGDYTPALRDKLIELSKVRYLAPGRTLETLVKTCLTDDQAKRIAFVKTDLEGYDKSVVRSSGRILGELKPTLFLEWFAYFQPEDDDDLFAAIAEVGYVPLHPHSLQPIDRANRTSDILCVHGTKLHEI